MGFYNLDIHFEDFWQHDKFDNKIKTEMALWVLDEASVDAGRNLLHSYGGGVNGQSRLALFTPNNYPVTMLTKFCSVPCDVKTADLEVLVNGMLRAYLIALGGDYLFYQAPSSESFRALRAGRA